MRINLPKDRQIIWTKHVLSKMRQYQLSGQRLLRLLRRPERQQSGIAPNTIAVMQTVGSVKHPTEVWLMYQPINRLDGIDVKKIKIITAWRYPGVSPSDQEIPIPKGIINELNI